MVFYNESLLNELLLKRKVRKRGISLLWKDLVRFFRNLFKIKCNTEATVLRNNINFMILTALKSF